MFKNYYTKIKSIFNRDRIIDNYSTDDIFIITFPKSGTTWLRFLIANAIKTHYDIKRNVNFFTIQDIIPGMPYTKYVMNKGPFGLTEIPRILATHSSYNPFYKRIIFQVRDPRDTMVSYYHHLRSSGSIEKNMSISDFIRDEKYGITAWTNHTTLWLKKNGPKDGMSRIIFTKYEDLLLDTASTLDVILQAIGLSLSDNELKKTLQLSSKEEMKKSEKNHLVTHIIGQKKKTNFVRKGIYDKGGAELSDDDVNFIIRVAGENMKILNYI
jgi:hypothetical protein